MKWGAPRNGEQHAFGKLAEQVQRSRARAADGVHLDAQVWYDKC